MKTFILLFILLSSCCNHSSINIHNTTTIVTDEKNYNAVIYTVDHGCVTLLEPEYCIFCGKVIELKEYTICGNFTIKE